MQMIPKFGVLCEGVKSCYLQTEKFRTNLFSVSFLLPKTLDRLAAQSLLTGLLTDTCNKYPNLTAINRRLAMLYGAHVSGTVSDLGDMHALRFFVSCLNDSFSLDGESITLSCVQLLCEMLFHPYLPNGNFCDADFQTEKRQLLEDVQAQINDKIRYAQARARQIMFDGTPFGLPEAGGEENVLALKSEAALLEWQQMLHMAPIIVSYIGPNDAQEIFSLFSQELTAIGRKAQEAPSSLLFPLSDRPIRTVTETMDLVQAKLVLGLRTATTARDELYYPMRMALDIFGGGVYSLLFTKVREQMGLCYYCSARPNNFVGAAFVNSGIEASDFEKVRDAIMQQLGDIQKGEFDDSLMEVSKLSFQNMMKTLYDSPSSLDAWFFLRMVDGSMTAIDEFCENICKVTAQEVVQAAERIKLDTVYLLTGKDGDTL